MKDHWFVIQNVLMVTAVALIVIYAPGNWKWFALAPCMTLLVPGEKKK